MVWLGKHALKVCSKSSPKSSSLKVIMISGTQKASGVREWKTKESYLQNRWCQIVSSLLICMLQKLCELLSALWLHHHSARFCSKVPCSLYLCNRHSVLPMLAPSVCKSASTSIQDCCSGRPFNASCMHTCMHSSILPYNPINHVNHQLNGLSHHSTEKTNNNYKLTLMFKLKLCLGFVNFLLLISIVILYWFVQQLPKPY